MAIPPRKKTGGMTSTLKRSEHSHPQKTYCDTYFLRSVHSFMWSLFSLYILQTLEKWKQIRRYYLPSQARRWSTACIITANCTHWADPYKLLVWAFYMYQCEGWLTWAIKLQTSWLGRSGGAFRVKRYKLNSVDEKKNLASGYLSRPW